MRKLTIKIIKAYQYLSRNVFGYVSSPLFASSCRFYPSCSDYAVDALNQYGFTKGSIKTIVRIIKCNPLSKPGVDLP